MLAVVAVVAVAPGLAGCGADAPSTAPGSTTPWTAAPKNGPGAAPDALTDVLNRLADADIPGIQKIGLVEDATADDAATLDRFGKALRDNGFTPPFFTVHDVSGAASDPGAVVATVDVTAPQNAGGGFSYPMEFRPRDGGWQLSRKTADLLLALGQPSTPTPPPVPEPAPPTPTR